MQEVPLPPGSAWLGKAWNDPFTFDSSHPSVQIFPGSPLLMSDLSPACHALFHALHSSSLLDITNIPVQMPCYYCPGSIVNTTAVAPTLWTDSFLPYAAIEPVLPDPQNADEPVSFKEVFATDSRVLSTAIKAP